MSATMVVLVIRSPVVAYMLRIHHPIWPILRRITALSFARAQLDHDYDFFLASRAYTVVYPFCGRRGRG